MAQLSEIIYDEKILPAIIDVIDNAKDYLVIVSPYNDDVPRIHDALERVAKRKIRITVVCRKDREKDEQAYLKWLMSSLGARVLLVERLHAKIYFNESIGIVTSMNLLTSSIDRSKEIGFKIDDRPTLRSIEDYVLGRLVEQAMEVTVTPKPKQVTLRKPKTASGSGLCIRCGKEEIPYNPDAPLCGKCYGTWKVHGNRTYPENYCHHCRKKRKTSFGRPLCKPCYNEVANAT